MTKSRSGTIIHCTVESGSVWLGDALPGHESLGSDQHMHVHSMAQAGRTPWQMGVWDGSQLPWVLSLALSCPENDLGQETCIFKSHFLSSEKQNHE